MIITRNKDRRNKPIVILNQRDNNGFKVIMFGKRLGRRWFNLAGREVFALYGCLRPYRRCRLHDPV